MSSTPPSDHRPAEDPAPEPDSGPGPDPSPATEPRDVPARTAPRGRLLRASALMASGSIVSRLLGFVRNFLFGLITAGSMTAVGNAVSAANFLPNQIWILVGGGVLNAILVPAIVRASRQDDRGADYVSRLMTLVVLLTGGLTVLCIALVPVLLTVTSGRLAPGTFAFAVQMGYWMMPQIMLSALYVMCGQLLNAHDSFGPYQWAPVMNNVVGILGALAFLAMWGSTPRVEDWTLTMIIALAAINIGGSAAQVLFLWVFVRRLGLRLRPRFGFRGLGLRKLGRIGTWTLAMLLVSQVGISATRWATGGASARAEELIRAGRAGEAAVYPALASIDWSYMAFMIPQGIIAVTLVTAAFPTISRRAAADDHAGAFAQYAQTSRMLAVPMVLCTAVFIALAGPIMWVIGGGTGPVAARANGWVLVAYMLGLVPFAATYLVKRVFYAYEQARAPFLMQLPNTLVSVLAVAPILAFVDPRWATATAAAVSSLGNLLGWVLGLWLLRRIGRRLGVRSGASRESAVVMGKLLLAGAVALLVGWGLLALVGDLVWIGRLAAIAVGAVIAAVMTVVFLGLAWLLRVRELRDLVDVLRRRRRRSRS
ncbi:hypothetical protein JSY14_07425 [Brachybacterium sp. EF45031]|uniref:murein biosynthesis integral membrane protein MurJ n=1 Tax=Brachybacterium sillae TaxID=2810536 RepID=UPI00217F1CD9|nr:lipid II flippase MurJ [Brachybacterium sillae]MCS6711859.1 hypothetical protein [Brachybacterium sillae]